MNLLRQMAIVLVIVGLVATVTTLLAQTPVQGDPARLERIRAAKMPPITKPILFNTAEADAILSALEVFPPDNPWNLVVSDWPLHPNSKNIIACIGADKPLRYNPDMGFVLVPPDQQKVDVKIVGYPDESDKGPFPVPDNMPIEGWPLGYRKPDGTEKATLDDVQRDRLKEGGDRHAIVVDPDQPDALRVLPGEEDRQGLAGGAGVDLRSEVEQDAARNVDLNRRRRAADLPGRGPLRRDRSAAWWSMPCA